MPRTASPGSAKSWQIRPPRPRSSTPGTVAAICVFCARSIGLHSEGADAHHLSVAVAEIGKYITERPADNWPLIDQLHNHDLTWSARIVGPAIGNLAVIVEG